MIFAPADYSGRHYNKKGRRPAGRAGKGKGWPNVYRRAGVWRNSYVKEELEDDFGSFIVPTDCYFRMGKIGIILMTRGFGNIPL